MPLSICLKNRYLNWIYIAWLRLTQHSASGIWYSDLWPLLATEAKTDQPMYKGSSLMNMMLLYLCSGLISTWDYERWTVITLGKTKQILFTPLLSQVVGHLGCQKKQNLLQFLDSLVWCAAFQSKLIRLKRFLIISIYEIKGKCVLCFKLKN